MRAWGLKLLKLRVLALALFFNPPVFSSVPHIEGDQEGAILNQCYDALVLEHRGRDSVTPDPLREEALKKYDTYQNPNAGLSELKIFHQGHTDD